MFLKKVDGPRAVTLQDGSVITLADLPDKHTMWWIASRKAAVVRGVLCGLITAESAKRRNGISVDEFQEWVRAVSLHGEAALRATSVQQYMQLQVDLMSI